MDNLIEFAKEQCTIFPEDSEIGKYLRETMKILQAEPCGDCVSRKSLKHKLQEHHDLFVNACGGFSNLPQKDKARVDAIANCIAMVVNEPPVKPARKKGKWIDRWDKILLCEDKNCSICGFLSQTTYNYCPNCGAEMESEE